MGRMGLLSRVYNASANQVEGFCIIKSVAVKSNVKGAAYLDMTLADAEGECNAKLWDYASEVHGTYEPNTVIKVRATINMWKDGEQLKIDRIRQLRENEEVDMSLLVPCAPIDPLEAYERIFATADEFTDPDLKLITQYLLKENREELLRWPAALKLHHAMRGGLLFHTVTMLESAKGIIGVYKPLYPALSSELVYAGIILHDIAKTKELVVGDLGLASTYSTEGQLLGHLQLGLAMIERAAAELMINEDTKHLLEHMIMAHHGVPEFGSPTPPMFPEAEIVSQVDLLDARLFEMFDSLSGIVDGGFTERLWALDNRMLYKHGHK